MSKSIWLILLTLIVLSLIAVLLFAACRSGTNETDDPADSGASLSFDSFDGGGPEYTVSLEDPSIATYTATRRYDKPNHAELDGAGYTVTFVFQGVKPGSTTVTVSADSPIAPEEDAVYTLVVDEALHVTLTLQEKLSEKTEAVKPVPTLVMVVNDVIVYPTLAQTAAADELVEKLSREEIELSLHDNGGFEKTGELPWSLPQSDVSMTAKPGDVLLYQGNQICLYYGENTWEFTPLATVDGSALARLTDALGDGDAAVRLWVEWSE